MTTHNMFQFIIVVPVEYSFIVFPDTSTIGDELISYPEMPCSWCIARAELLIIFDIEIWKLSLSHIQLIILSSVLVLQSSSFQLNCHLLECWTKIFTSSTTSTSLLLVGHECHQLAYKILLYPFTVFNQK